MLTVKQLAHRLGLSTSKCYELIARGEIVHYRMGGSIRVSEDQLKAYLERTERGGEPPRKTPIPRARLKHISL